MIYKSTKIKSKFGVETCKKPITVQESDQCYVEGNNIVGRDVLSSNVYMYIRTSNSIRRFGRAVYRIRVKETIQTLSEESVCVAHWLLLQSKFLSLYLKHIHLQWQQKFTTFHSYQVDPFSDYSNKVICSIIFFRLQYKGHTSTDQGLPL